MSERFGKARSVAVRHLCAISQTFSAGNPRSALANGTVLECFGKAGNAAVRHLCAISQTFFVSNPWTALASIAVLGIAAPRLAVAALVTSILARWAGESMGAAWTFLATGLIELNGWFLGLACATFFGAGPSLAVIVLVSGPLVAAFSIAMQRVLATWGVPLLVGPYVPVFWLLWSGLSGLPWVNAAALPAALPPPDSPLVVVLLGGLRGVGQIFFLPDARVGVALALAASIADWRIGPAMIAASVASVGIGYLGGAPLWQVEQGLAGFIPALVAAAALQRFVGIGGVAVGVAIAAAPFIEMAAVRLAGVLGLYTLSAPYIGLVWLLALLRPVRQATVVRTGWSMGASPQGSRPIDRLPE
jgi:urea transporter